MEQAMKIALSIMFALCIFAGIIMVISSILEFRLRRKIRKYLWKKVTTGQVVMMNKRGRENDK